MAIGFGSPWLGFMGLSLRAFRKAATTEPPARDPGLPHLGRSRTSHSPCFKVLKILEREGRNATGLSYPIQSQPCQYVFKESTPYLDTSRNHRLTFSCLPQLILISGYPSSGKTHRSTQLVSFITRKIAESQEPKIQRLKVHHITDQNLGLSRDVYAAARSEKDARATFSSAIKRVLTRDDVVVADGMNYIKGFRYQLYCEAKAVQTPSCVVHVGVIPEKARELNQKALDEGTGGYDPDVFENLVFRYEEPNGMTRWDSPLFVVPFDDPEPPCRAIWEAMVGSDGKAKVVRPNTATVLKPASEQNYLYELDKTTSDVVNAIKTWQQDHSGEGGGEVRVPGAEQAIVLPATSPSLPQLQRLRRHFIGLNRQHTLSKSRIRDLFVDYLNDAFQS
jgi:protein KTI12